MNKLFTVRNLHLTWVYTVILTLFLLMPFDFSLPYHYQDNQVAWMVGGRGVHFFGNGLLQSPAAPQHLFHQLTQGQGLSIELWLSTDTIQQAGPARIVSYSQSNWLRNFTLGQEDRDLVMRLRTTATDRNGVHPTFRVGDVFQAGQRQHLVLTYDRQVQRLYVDGQLRKLQLGPGGDFSNWDPTHLLTLGNEATGERPWRGQLVGVALYDRALTEEEVKQFAQYREAEEGELAVASRLNEQPVLLYSFAEGRGNRVYAQSGQTGEADLYKPATIKVGDSRLLIPPYSEFGYLSPGHQLLEIVGNIVLFIPVGFLFFRTLLERRGNVKGAAAGALAVGIFLTFAIECSHYFVATKTSSWTDVIHNSIGAALGVTLGVGLYYRGQRERSGHRYLLAVVRR